MLFSKFRMGLFGLVLAASVGLVWSASQDSTARDDILAAQATWVEAKLVDYSFTLTRHCFCPGPHAWRVEVRQGRVQRASDVATGEAVSASELSRLPTLSGLFDLVLAAYQRQAAVVQVKTHVQYGFPERVFIDYDLRMADEEMRYQVTDFSR